jgi:hypothetical protein
MPLFDQTTDFRWHNCHPTGWPNRKSKGVTELQWCQVAYIPSSFITLMIKAFNPEPQVCLQLGTTNVPWISISSSRFTTAHQQRLKNLHKWGMHNKFIEKIIPKMMDIRQETEYSLDICWATSSTHWVSLTNYSYLRSFITIPCNKPIPNLLSTLWHF